MKRGKDEGKALGPMFPRLHVNDTDKGGPRAPPRNKMALYEQLSIPSQRFNPSPMPLNPNSTNCLVTAGSLTRLNDHDRRMQFPLHLPPSAPAHLAERGHSRQPDAVSLDTSLARPELRTKVGDEDDFMVPVFVHAGVRECDSRSHDNRDIARLTPLSPSCSYYSMKHRNTSEIDLKRSTSGLSLGQGDEENPKDFVSGGHAVKSAINLPSGGTIDGSQKQVNASSDLHHQDHPGASFSRFRENENSLQQESRAGLQLEDVECGDGFLHESARDGERRNTLNPRADSQSGLGKSNSNEPEIDGEDRGEKTSESLNNGNVDKSDDASETSMVDSISGLDISPDVVVGVMGQKLFWKARRAIVNQQKVFAVQVFELHRLIKVQRLFAGSPHLLLEDCAHLGDTSLEGAPVKKLPSEYIVNSLQPTVKRKFDSDKPNHNLECSADNAVGKTSLSSMKTSILPSNYEPHLGFPPAPVTNAQMGPWCFPQPPGHQWLVPVMSPSEGLIYKPYPGPGLRGPIFGGCGPMGTSPLSGNFFNPAYSVLSSNHGHPGTGVLPGAPPVSCGYFPPYNMPVFSLPTSGSEVKQVKLFDEPGSDGQTDQLSRGNLDVPHQSACNVPSQKNGATSQVKFQVSKDSDLQGSTASSSSPCVRADETGTANIAEGGDALPLFPIEPAVPEEAPQHHDSDQLTQVIKVVPHNRRSATESAARIFQSIQDERKQYDST